MKNKYLYGALLFLFLSALSSDLAAQSIPNISKVMSPLGIWCVLKAGDHIETEKMVLINNISLW